MSQSAQTSVQYTPEKEDVEEGTYALVIHEDGQDLWKYEQPTPWDDPEWTLKRQYDHGEVPPLDLKSAIVEQKANEGSLQVVTLYADDVGAVETPGSQTATSGETESRQDLRGYIVELNDGQRIPEERFNTTQEQNMGEMVDYLIQEYDLIERIDIPYYPPRSYKNCLINDLPEYEDGRDMRGPFELSSGHYLQTSLNSDQKKKYMKLLAEECGLDIEFKGEW